MTFDKTLRIEPSVQAPAEAVFDYFFCLGQERQGNRGPPAAVSHLPH